MRRVNKIPMTRTQHYVFRNSGTFIKKYGVFFVEISGTSYKNVWLPWLCPLRVVPGSDAFVDSTSGSCSTLSHLCVMWRGADTTKELLFNPIDTDNTLLLNTWCVHYYAYSTKETFLINIFYTFWRFLFKLFLRDY